MATTPKIIFLVILAKLASGDFLNQLVRQPVVLMLDPSSSKSQRPSELTSSSSNEDSSVNSPLALLNYLTQYAARPTSYKRPTELDRMNSKYSRDRYDRARHEHNKYDRQLHAYNDGSHYSIHDKNHRQRHDAHNREDRHHDRHHDRHRERYSRPNNYGRLDKYERPEKYERLDKYERVKDRFDDKIYNTLQEKLRDEREENLYKPIKQKYRTDDDLFPKRHPKLKKYRSPIVKSLLRMAKDLNCDAQDDCKDECGGSNKNKCENKCEVKFECEDEKEEDDGGCDVSNDCGEEEDELRSTKGEILMTEKSACKNCKKK